MSSPVKPWWSYALNVMKMYPNKRLTDREKHGYEMTVVSLDYKTIHLLNQSKTKTLQQVAEEMGIPFQTAKKMYSGIVYAVGVNMGLE